MDNLNDFIKETVLFYLNGLRAAWQGFKRFWYVPLVMLILVGGFMLSRKQATQYTGKIVFTYNYMDALFYAKTFEELQDLINNDGLANVLDLSQEAASSVKGVEVKDYRGELISRMQTVKGPIYLHLNLSNESHNAEIEQGFTNYINEHPFVVKEIQKFQKTNKDKAGYLEKELGILDSLKRNGYGSSSNGQSTIDLASLFQESEKKFQELQDIKSGLEKNVAIEVFKPLLTEQNKSGKSKTFLKWFLIWAMLSGVLCYLFGIIADENKPNG